MKTAEQMTPAELLAFIHTLPEPDLLTAGEITDPLGANTFYSARTVVELLAKERERCAKLVESANEYRGGHGHPPVLSVDEIAALLRRPAI